jgi:hypothetical protein
MQHDRRGYAAAGRTAAIDQANPERRSDARHIADAVRKSDTRGLRRDYLETFFCLDPAPAPGWPIARFKAALFYAYGMRWVAFIGWTYVVDPGPVIPLGPRLTDAERPACPPERRHDTTGIFDISTGTATNITGAAQ